MTPSQHVRPHLVALLREGDPRLSVRANAHVFDLHQALTSKPLKAALHRHRIEQLAHGVGLERRVGLSRFRHILSKCETGVRRLDVIELKLWVQALGWSLPGFLTELQTRTDLADLPEGRSSLSTPP